MLGFDLLSSGLAWSGFVAVMAVCVAGVPFFVYRQLKTVRELKQTIARLRSALAEAKDADQSKSDFLSTMSHELRTPLNAIIGFSEILKGQLFGPLGSERYRSYAEAICEGGEHLLSLINDILDLSKIDAGKLELHEDCVDVSAALKACRRLVEPQALQAQVRFTLDAPEGLPRLRADDRRLRQVLINLFSNAVKFTPGGGEVKVSAFHIDGALAIAVADTGVGMAEKDIPTALERFGQIDNPLGRKHAGTGLGLPLSKQLVELHGGTLAIDSTPNVGTTVTVLFPSSRLVGVQEAA